MTSVCDVYFQSLWDHTSHEVWNAIGYMSLELGDGSISIVDIGQLTNTLEILKQKHIRLT